MPGGVISYGHEEREQPDVWRAENVCDVERAREPGQVRLEVGSDGNLADGRADRGCPDATGCKDLARGMELFIVQVEHVDVPRAAELDVLDSQPVEGFALGLQVRADF